jgi:hypothetical protein
VDAFVQAVQIRDLKGAFSYESRVFFAMLLARQAVVGYVLYPPLFIAIHGLEALLPLFGVKDIL